MPACGRVRKCSADDGERGGYRYPRGLVSVCGVHAPEHMPWWPSLLWGLAESGYGMAERAEIRGKQRSTDKQGGNNQAKSKKQKAQ